tara:strand:- start:233 stop:523 length:291 start_codon:yes stop_codon:yes gene_type:complete
MREALLTALEARYEAQISEAHAVIKIYLENSVGIGEHPQHIDEIDKQLQIIADAEEKLETLEDFHDDFHESESQREPVEKEIIGESFTSKNYKDDK